MRTIRLKKGTEFSRVEVSEERRYDNPKFYAYLRDKKCDEKLWAKRCINYCRFLRVIAKRDLKLMNVPYKSLLYVEDPTEEDIKLAKTFVRLAKRIYKDDKNKIECVKKAVTDLILLKPHAHFRCAELLNDWTIATLICKAGFDGMIRYVEGDTPNCYDEVAICFPDDRLEVVHEEMIPVN